jgi:hypothetical protein
MTTSTSPTAKQIGLLHHTLGLRPDRRESYRNHFVAGPGHHDQADLQALVALGLMARSPTPRFLDQTDEVFHVTPTGKDLALRELPEPEPEPKKSAHREWLDADSGFSFGEWLCGHQLPKVESEATHALVEGKYRRVARHRYYRLERNSHWRREIEGQWAKTKKEAKASYKAALKAHRAAQAPRMEHAT